MSPSNPPALTRRLFLTSGLALPAAGLLLQRAFAATSEISLQAASGRFRIMPEPYGETAVWAYNGTVPGPEIRVRQGDRLSVLIQNGLEQDTTIHWHGVRVPNAMDGVPQLTQEPIAPGGTFTYEFDAIDAGTFWYHPHINSAEQVGRGLYAPLIIEEPEPIQVDRDVTWVLDDWRLLQSAEISGDFGNAMDMQHNGRIGNKVTINGRLPTPFVVNKGERIRLRLINAANARIFGLSFADHEPVVIALDGQPVTPHVPEAGVVILGPAMRADLIIDFTGATGSQATVTDLFYTGFEYPLVEIAYADTALRDRTPDWPMALPPNPLPEPDIENAVRHDVVFNGGMMGEAVEIEMHAKQQMQSAQYVRNTASMGAMMGHDMDHVAGIWFINGVAASGHIMDPMLTLARDKSHVISMTNETAWHHPIHLHGHSFRVISRNGEPTLHRPWQDTALMSPKDRVEIAFVADNPGDWMIHCHILEHQMSGMMGVFRVA